MYQHSEIMIVDTRKLLIFIPLIRYMIADVIVKLPNGLIQGRTAVTQTQSPYYAFEKIPYAAPPIGNLRFKAPVPPPNWDGILNTTKLDVICYQIGSNPEQENEDCLYLNVYTPQVITLPQNGSADKLAVMLFIYGGGFIAGDSLDTNYGPEYLIDSGVIVITFNYRVGPFGFLSTQDLVIPGNYGLKDQHLAIQWVHDNVELFGGDAERTIIFGESAGAVSITYQLLNPKSEGLFSGVICESGSFLSPWAYQRNAREIAFKTASFINESFADNNDSTTLLEFLMNLPASDIDTAATMLTQLASYQNTQILQGFFYAPIIEPDHEEAILTEKMYLTLNKGNIVKVPALIGINSEEGLSLFGNLEDLQARLEAYDNNLDWLVPNDMNIQDDELKKEVGASIRSIYAANQSLASNLAFGVKYFSDDSFTRSIIKHAELQSNVSSVYFYQFSYWGPLGGSDNGIDVPGTEKVGHGAELPYIWKMQNGWMDNSNLSKFPENDVITQKRMLQLWTNFAKELNPTPETSSDLLQNITWPPVSLEEDNHFWYLDIGENLEIKSDPKQETYAAWNTIYNSLGYNDFDTY